MTTEHRCPLGDSPLQPHASKGNISCFSRQCEQEVPYSVEGKTVKNIITHQEQMSTEKTGLLTQNLSQTFTLGEILQTTIDGIAQFLEVDRVLIAQMMPSGGLTVTVEWLQRPWKTLLHYQIGQFSSFSDIKTWEKGKIEAIANINQDNEQASTMMTLDSSFDVKAKVIVPIRGQGVHPTSNHRCDQETNQPLWGLIMVHQCSGPRQWTSKDLGFLSLQSTQLMIAIKQNQSYQHIKTVNRQLEVIAFEDRLTQVYNRHYFQRYFHQEWRRMSREKQYLSLILCDVDFFKAYNDTYGHPQGDRCLQEVAYTIKSTLHRPGDMVARYGGEEFVIILPNTQPAGALHVAEQIRSAVKRLKLPSANHKVSEYVTISLGVGGVIPNASMSFQQLLQVVDQALYQAKEQGRDGAVLWQSQEKQTAVIPNKKPSTLIPLSSVEDIKPKALLQSYVAYFLSRGLQVSSPVAEVLPFHGLVYQYEGYHQDFVNWWRQLEQRNDYQQLSLTGDIHSFEDFLEGGCGVQECAHCNLPIVMPTGNLYDLPGCSLCLNDNQGCQRKNNHDEIKDNENCRLLVITDTQENIQMLEQWLTRNGIEAVFISDVTQINKCLFHQKISAVIFDTHVDQARVKSWVEELEKYPALQDIPVIALSEKSGYGLPWLNRTLKLEDYILTPFNGDELVNYLQNLSKTHDRKKHNNLYWFPR
ncbi:MAG: diguanylate cyclase [Crocosphaera sp.]